MSALCVLWWVFFCVEFRFFLSLFLRLFFISFSFGFVSRVCVCVCVVLPSFFLSVARHRLSHKLTLAVALLRPFCVSMPSTHCRILCIKMVFLLSSSIKYKMKYEYRWRRRRRTSIAHYYYYYHYVRMCNTLFRIHKRALGLFVHSLGRSLMVWNLYFSSVFESAFCVVFSFLLHSIPNVCSIFNAFHSIRDRRV